MLDDIEARRARIEAYDLDFLRKSFRANHPRYARRFGPCVRELRRLFAVMLFAKEPVEVTSLAVDALLGEFIARDREYREFCDAVYGEYLRRVPAPEGYEPGGRYADVFYRLYEELYTAVPEIWVEDVPVPAE